MSDLTLRIEVDPAEVAQLKTFGQGMADSLSEVTEKYPEVVIDKKDGRPKGSLGDPNIFTYVIENIDTIRDAAQVVYYVVSTANILFQNVFRRKKEDTTKTTDKAKSTEAPLIEEVRATITIEKKTYQLPLSVAEMEEIKKTTTK